MLYFWFAIKYLSHLICFSSRLSVLYGLLAQLNMELCTGSGVLGSDPQSQTCTETPDSVIAWHSNILSERVFATAK